MTRSTVFVTVMAAVFTAGCNPAPEPQVARSYDDLLGTWIISPEASLESMMSDPKWDDDAARYVPRVLKRMGKVHLAFEEDAIAYLERGEESLRLRIIGRDEQPGEFSLAVLDGDREDTINIRVLGEFIAVGSASSDDMKHYRWTRGIPNPDEYESDLAMVLDMFLEGVNDSHDGQQSPE